MGATRTRIRKDSHVDVKCRFESVRGTLLALKACTNYGLPCDVRMGLARIFGSSGLRLRGCDAARWARDGAMERIARSGATRCCKTDREPISADSCGSRVHMQQRRPATLEHR